MCLGMMLHSFTSPPQAATAARLDLVGDDGVAAAPEAADPPDLDDVGARAHDVGPHGVEEVGHVHDVGLLGGVFNDGHALGHGGGEHNVDGGPHRGLVQEDVGPLQPAAGGLGHDKAALGVHLGPQGAKTLQMLVDGPGAAEVAPAGQGHVRAAEAAQQGPQHIVGGAAPAGGLIGHPAAAEAGAVDLYGVGVYITHLCAQILENAQQQRHVADPGHVLNAAGAADHQGSGDNSDGSVFRAADVDLSKQGTSALDNILGQRFAPLFNISADRYSLPRPEHFIPKKSAMSGHNRR